MVEREGKRVAALEKALEEERNRLANVLDGHAAKFATSCRDKVTARQEEYSALKQYTLREHNAAWLALSFAPTLLLGDGVLNAIARAQRRRS